MNIEILEVKIQSDDTQARGRHSRVYCSPKGETILENFLGGRRNRPVDLLRASLKEELPRHGVDARHMTWSQKAGCGCGCSPGFILSERGRSIWVTYQHGKEE